MEKKAREIHGQEEVAREQGRFLDALMLSDEATIQYQKEGDRLGLSEIQAARQITFRHLHRKTGDSAYLILAKHSAEAAVEIAEASGIKEALALPYFNLGKIYGEMEDWQKACENLKLAVSNMQQNPPELHNRPAVLLDMQGHLYAYEYSAGDKTALEKAEKALEDLLNTDEVSYNKNVWASGAHLRIAFTLRKENPQKAKEHLAAARKIIESDERLILRKEQLEKAEADLKI